MIINLHPAFYMCSIKFLSSEIHQAITTYIASYYINPDYRTLRKI